jgi:hypothetical protein
LLFTVGGDEGDEDICLPLVMVRASDGVEMLQPGGGRVFIAYSGRR